MNRFDSIQYDGQSQALQVSCKQTLMVLENVMGYLPDGRSKDMALLKIEEAYAWIRKSIRDGQLARTQITTRERDKNL